MIPSLDSSVLGTRLGVAVFWILGTPLGAIVFWGGGTGVLVLGVMKGDGVVMGDDVRKLGRLSRKLLGLGVFLPIGLALTAASSGVGVLE